MPPPDPRARERTPSVFTAPTVWRNGKAVADRREIPEETAVALVHDASTTAVMMATPADLEDFVVGFSLTEAIITRVDQIRSVEIVETPHGIEARAWLAAPASTALTSRRRLMLGPTGCGLCGVDSLAEAVKPPRRVAEGFRLRSHEIAQALERLSHAQTLGAATRAVHAAAWWTPEGGVLAIREDVGRHNALDKLVGALARSEMTASAGAVVLTSRVSVEMVQKAAVLGAQVLIAVSAPTALAVRTAEAAGLTLVAVARKDGFEVFTGAERIVP